MMSAGNRIAALAETIDGQLLEPEQAGYDEARRVWNAMIDRRPALVIKPSRAEDVCSAVKFVRDAGCELAVRGGGHNIAGSGVCDGGVLIDLSGMREVQVDVAARVARVQGVRSSPTSTAPRKKKVSRRPAGSSPRPAWAA